MDLHTVIESGFEEKLKCFSCHNYLSYFPISTCSNNQSICGRCKAPEGITCFKDEAFEALSQKLHFPCRYKSEGCCEELLPKDIPQHEENCQYRVVPCLVQNPTRCNWIGSLPLLTSHIRQEHFTVIMKNREFELDLSSGSQLNEYLVENDGYFLIFKIMFVPHNSELYCCIRHGQYQSDCEKRTCQLKIGNGKRFLLLDLEIVNYEHEGRVETVCLKSVFTNDAKLSGQILINRQTPLVEIETIPEEVNKKLLPLLKCITCSQLVLPLVIRCIRNLKPQPMCALCFSDHLKSCSDCKKHGNEGIDNFLIPALNEIAELVLYPCQYQHNGCSLMFKSGEISNHDLKCHYQNTVCPLSSSHSCKWSGLKKEISNHILTEHETVIKKSPFEGVIKSETITYDVVQFSDDLFRVAYCKASDNNYKWSVQNIETSQEEFLYEVEILDGSNSGQRFVCRKACLELTPQDKIFDESSKYFYFQKQQVLDFCPSGTEDLKFKIRIVK